MNCRGRATLALCLAWGVCGTGCNGSKSDPQAEAPPPLKLERVENNNLFRVDHPELFQLTVAAEHDARPQLQVTGTVNPDISLAVPVISLATGRVLHIFAHLGDTVQKGQLLLTVRARILPAPFPITKKLWQTKNLPVFSWSARRCFTTRAQSS